MNKIFLDHASATPVKKDVLDEMLPFFSRDFENPSTVYDRGMEIKDRIEQERARVANLVNAKEGEIIFTSSGAEANNLAVKGAALARPKKGKHIIVSAIEHHSVLNSARFLERQGYETSFLNVDKYGLVDLNRLEDLIRPETVLVSVMHANNEIGTIEPIREISEITKQKDVLLHTDAVASLGNIEVDVENLGVDLLTISSPSIGGPKGVGALYFKNNMRLMPLIHGGIQEKGRRGGTENVPGIVGLGKAAEIAKKELFQKEKNLTQLRDRLINGVLDNIDKVRLTGHPELRLPGHASFCVEAIEGEALIFMLSASGIYTNTGSACASKALKTSPVLIAVGTPEDVAQGSVVFTFDTSNTQQEIDYVVETLPIVSARLREMSPIWNAA